MYECFYWRLYIKPKLFYNEALKDSECFYWRLYIKPKRRKCKGLKDNEITSAEFSKKWKCKYLIVAKLLKKFQLYGLRRFLFLDSSPNVDDIAILSVGNRKDTHLPMIWDRQAYTLEMNLCAFKRGTETHVDTKLKHHKPILL